MADQPVYQTLLWSGVSALWVLTLLVVAPLVLIAICRTAIRLPAIHEFTQVPLLLKLTVPAGAVLGFVFIAAQPEHASTSVEAVFMVGGPWDISFTELLLTRLNPLAFNYVALVDYLMSHPPWGFVPTVTAGAILALLASFLVCLRIWPMPQSIAACLACVLLSAVTAYLVLYAFVSLLWGLNKLSFLVFPLLLLLIRPPLRLRGSKKS